MANTDVNPWTICRHCKQRNVNRPRGLCFSCYYRPGVIDLYPSTSKYATRGHGTGYSSSPLPSEPTTHMPGTPERIAVLEFRASLKQSLFHPEDARINNPHDNDWQRVCLTNPQVDTAELQRSQKPLVATGECESGRDGDDD